MLKILPFIPSSTSPKFTHNFFILISLPIIHILFLCLLLFQVLTPEKHGVDAYLVVAMHIHILAK